MLKFSTGPYLKKVDQDYDRKWNRIPVHFIQLGPRFPSVTVDIPPLQNPLLDSADPAFHPNPSRVTDPANAPDLSRVADPAKSPWPVSGSPKSFHEISPTEKQALSVEKPDLEISPPVCYRPIPREIRWLLNQIPLLAFKRTYYLMGFERIWGQNEQIEKFIAPFSANSVHFQKTRKKVRPDSVISASVCQNTPDLKMRIRQKDTVRKWSKKGILSSETGSLGDMRTRYSREMPGPWKRDRGGCSNNRGLGFYRAGKNCALTGIFESFSHLKNFCWYFFSTASQDPAFTQNLSEIFPSESVPEKIFLVRLIHERFSWYDRYRDQNF